ncbi:RNA-binding protein [Streptoalloteichus hindustanus]|uniref:Small subunit ribosomal protein S1 n=1 Tax=Streptoalloteichus hindustanus TaxID=2017 RepID=A0A1M5MIC6_STRHI|nr:RNA-binding protein [Streptoalloteichus hindustanus]SHG76971.1 hypothetical protein SAMN05444320_113128 [Streptoalloteichus hindustanus]
MLPYVHRVTKFDPADRDEHGHYVGDQDVTSDHGVLEAAYLAAVTAFAEDTGVTTLTIRDPELAPGISFGAEAPMEGHGLIGLFPADLAGYHDGAQVPLALGVDLVRVMLREAGAWCRLEVEGRFFVHIGFDQYMYVGSAEPCDRAVAHARALGLFPERLVASPYDPSFDEPVDRRSADESFWAEVAELVDRRGTVILEEGYVQGASRWHRLHSTTIDAVRAALAPRARVLVWPELDTDNTTVLRRLAQDDVDQLVWEDENGVITDRFVRVALSPRQAAQVARTARAVMGLKSVEDERHPLLAAVLPDEDGVLRARWEP